MQDLHILIKSLSPTEKRYVTIYINKFSSTKNNYSKLYENVEKQDFYNEDEIIKKLRKEPFIKNLAVTKHYLFELILNAMREYYDEHFLDWRLKKQVAQIFVLTSKGLDSAALKLITKTKKEAWLYENYYVLLDILNHEKWLFGNRRIALNNTDYGVEICKEESEAFSNILLIQKYKSIWHQLTQLELTQTNYSTEEYHDKLEYLIKNDVLQKPPLVSSYLIKTWFHVVLAHYYMLINDHQNHFINYKEVAKIREYQIEIQPETPIDLIATYYNFMLSCYQNKQWSDLSIYLEKIKNIETKSIEKKIKFFHDYYHCALLYNLGTENYTNGYELLDNIKNGLNTYENKIRLDFLIWICQCAGLICFFNKKYKEANFWWMKILNLDKTFIEIKIQCSVKLYSLILTIDDDNTDVLPYQIKQAEKFIKANQFLKPAEIAFFSFIKLLNKKGKINIHKKEWKLQYELQRTITAQNIPFAVDEFVLKWLKTKAE